MTIFTTQEKYHGFGKQLPENSSLNEWLDKTGLCYDVIRKPVLYYNSEHKLENLLNKDVLIRNDNHRPLSIVSKNYKVVQPREVLFFFEDLINELNFKMESVGIINNGKKIFALAKTPMNFKLANDDVVNCCLLLATSYDTSMSTVVMLTSVRVACINALNIALKDNKFDRINISHLKEFKPHEVKLELGLIEKTWDNFKENCEKLVDTKMTENERNEFYRKLLNVSDDETEENNKKKQVISLLNDIYYNFDGQNTVTTKDTAFGVLNSVTAYVDHFRGNKRYKSFNNSRTNKALFSQGNNLKNKAFKMLVNV